MYKSVEDGCVVLQPTSKRREREKLMHILETYVVLDKPIFVGSGMCTSQDNLISKRTAGDFLWVFQKPAVGFLPFSLHSRLCSKVHASINSKHISISLSLPIFTHIRQLAPLQLAAEIYKKWAPPTISWMARNLALC